MIKMESYHQFRPKKVKYFVYAFEIAARDQVVEGGFAIWSAGMIQAFSRSVHEDWQITCNRSLFVLFQPESATQRGGVALFLGREERDCTKKMIFWRARGGDRQLFRSEYTERAGALSREVKMISLVKAQTASFDVDPQRGFTPLCPDELPVVGGDAIADELNRQAGFAAWRLVSKDNHPADAPWRTDDPARVLTPVPGDYPNLDVLWPAHCVVGTEGNRLIPGLPDEADYDLVVGKGSDPEKHPYGACYHDLAETESTGAIEWLREHGVTTVLVGGLATDYCMKTTALQLKQAGFAVIVNLAACRGVDPASTDAVVAQLKAAGVDIVASAAELQGAP